MIKAVIFDLDDTLTDRQASIEAFATPFAAYFADELRLIEREAALLVRDLRDDGYRSRADVCQEIIEILAWTKAPTIEELLTFWWAEFPRSVIGFDGLVDVLDALVDRNIATGLVTNGNTVVQHTKVDVLGIRQHLGVVLVSEEIGIAKPDAAIFRRALEALGVQPNEALFVGDNAVNDIEGARNVGMLTAWMSNGREWPQELAPPAYSVDSLRQLLEFV